MGGKYPPVCSLVTISSEDVSAGPKVSVLFTEKVQGDSSLLQSDSPLSLESVVLSFCVG
jgi:hypothetical protein